MSNSIFNHFIINGFNWNNVTNNFHFNWFIRAYLALLLM